MGQSTISMAIFQWQTIGHHHFGYIPLKPIKTHETTIFLWFSYGFPRVFLWFSYGFHPEVVYLGAWEAFRVDLNPTAQKIHVGPQFVKAKLVLT